MIHSQLFDKQLILLEQDAVYSASLEQLFSQMAELENTSKPQWRKMPLVVEVKGEVLFLFCECVVEKEQLVAVCLQVQSVTRPAA